MEQEKGQGMSESYTERRLQTVCLLILAAVASGFALRWLAPVVVPFILAVLFALILLPVIDFQVRRLRFHRSLAILSTLTLGFVILFFFGGFITAPIAQFASGVDEYESGVTTLLNEGENYLDGLIAGLGIEKISERFNMETDIQDLINLDTVIPAGTAKSLFMGLSTTIFTLFSQTVLVMLFLVFLLLGAPTREKPREGVVGEIEKSVRAYLVTKVLVSLLTGVLVFLILWFFKVPYALTFGVFAFLLNFIPNIGSIVACILPVPFILLSPELSTVAKVVAIALPGGVQLTVGNFIEPKMMGDSLDMHPVVVLLALMFWGMIWGIAGMILAVPLTVVIKIVMERIEVTAPIARLMGNGESR
jgi:AI-2 transport protein TqsA